MYDPRDAPNRRIKRLIENDNNKARNKEKNAFNDKVRDLLSHVQRKDPRWEAFTSEDRAARDAYRREANAKKAEDAAAAEEKLKKYREELAEYYRKEEEEALMRGDVDEVFEEEFRCGICKKSFKKEG